MEAKNVTHLVREIKQSPELLNELNNNPLGFLEKVQEPKPLENKWIFLFIVSIVGVVLLATVAMGSILIVNGKTDVPEFLVSISSTALGAIVGLLAPSPRQQ